MEKKVQVEEKDIGWDTNIFRPQTGSKTSYGRRMNKNESAVEV
jgi:hypothetical protein